MPWGLGLSGLPPALAAAAAVTGAPVFDSAKTTQKINGPTET